MPRPKQNKKDITDEIITNLNAYLNEQSAEHESVLNATVQLNRLKMVKKKVTSLVKVLEEERDMLIIRTEIDKRKKIKIKRGEF